MSVTLFLVYLGHTLYYLYHVTYSVAHRHTGYIMYLLKSNKFLIIFSKICLNIIMVEEKSSRLKIHHILERIQSRTSEIMVISTILQNYIAQKYTHTSYNFKNVNNNYLLILIWTYICFNFI